MRLREWQNKANHNDDRIFKIKWGNNESSAFIKVEGKRFLPQFIYVWDMKAAFNKSGRKIPVSFTLTQPTKTPLHCGSYQLRNVVTKKSVFFRSLGFNLSL